ncbi:rhomboid family intramembrane serine protease [Nocardioides daphniae]|uniref:Rhomboid family intramembrane serine protease n=1 Tax=Nocardioides daphniae TaxID=402297 RepID=A0A4P7UEH9_9ACTN|nr:rhomboid family intramembrane serine protease [Nocardioides daphniae]
MSGEQGLWFPNATDSALCSQVPGATWHPGLSDGALWQVLTHGFTHVDIWHIALNALGLWILGPPIEQVLGRWRFLAVYLLSTLAAGATVFAFADEQSSTLGASGGVFGLMGALLLISWRRWRHARAADAARPQRLHHPHRPRDLLAGPPRRVRGWRARHRRHRAGTEGQEAVVLAVAGARRADPAGGGRLRCPRPGAGLTAYARRSLPGPRGARERQLGSPPENHADNAREPAPRGGFLWFRGSLWREPPETATGALQPVENQGISGWRSRKIIHRWG